MLFTFTFAMVFLAIWGSILIGLMFIADYRYDGSKEQSNKYMGMIFFMYIVLFGYIITYLFVNGSS